MSDTSKAERDVLNQGLQNEDDRLHDEDGRPPHSLPDNEAPKPERPVTPQENAEQDVANLENPPQSEGPRERNNDAV